MDRDAELKCLTDTSRLNALANAAPKCSVEQDHVDGLIEDVSGELFKINDDSISCQRHSHLFADTPHAVKTVNRVFQVIVVNVLDLLPEPDGLFGGPNGVRIET